MATMTRSRWARLGLAGAAVFLVKGLLWLLVPVVLWLRSSGVARAFDTRRHSD